MKFENTTIEKSPTKEKPIESEESIMDKRDIERIDEIIENIGKTEKSLTFEEYNKKQVEETQKDPNRHLTALKLEKKDDDLLEEEMLMHFAGEKDKHGFSLSTRFAIENTQYRKDLSDETLKDDYFRLRKQIEEALEDIKEKQTNI